jgi:hypothetical protein
MNYFIDAEFYEDGERIHFISIAIVCEDGRELYYENGEFDWSIVPADHWIQANVRPHLWTENYDMGPEIPPQFDVTDTGVSNRAFIANRIRNFCLRPDKGAPVFFGYFCDYDWVVLCQLFGRMVDLPKGFPYFCMDLKQMMEERKLTSEWKRIACPDPVGEHNALVDARWNASLHKYIIEHKTPHSSDTLSIL